MGEGKGDVRIRLVGLSRSSGQEDLVYAYDVFCILCASSDKVAQ